MTKREGFFSPLVNDLSRLVLDFELSCFNARLLVVVLRL
jgi:hypothetical protein